MAGATARHGWDVISSDHSGYSYEGAHGKRVNGVDAPFRDIPNGVPGLGRRLPIVFSEGVGKGRIDVNEFVRLTASNPARLFGLYPRKGTLTPGADADLVLWDPAKRVTIANDLLQHVIDYTPYEGLRGHRLAGGDTAAWPCRDARRQGAGGAGQRAIPGARPLRPDQAYRASAQRVRRGFGAGLSSSGYGRGAFREAHEWPGIDPDIFGPAESHRRRPRLESRFSSQTGQPRIRVIRHRHR